MNRRIAGTGAALAAVAGAVMVTAAALPAHTSSGVTVWSATSRRVTVTSTSTGPGDIQDFTIPPLPGASFTQTPGEVMLLTAHITNTLLNGSPGTQACDVTVRVVTTGSGLNDGVKVAALAQRGDVAIETSSLAFPAPTSTSHPGLQLSGTIESLPETPGVPPCLGQTYRVSVRVSVAMLGK